MKRMSLVVVMLLVIAVAWLAGEARPRLNPELVPCVGQWQGRGKVIVLWCELDSLRVDVTIDSMGNVHGTIGDATVIDAELGRRSWLMRRLGISNSVCMEAVSTYRA